MNPDAAQQAEIDQARARGRVVITIRCANPLQLPNELMEIVDCSGEHGGLGSPKPDLTPVIRPGWFDR